MLQFLYSSFCAALLVLLAGTAVAADKAPVRVAFIDPLSGPLADVGVPALAQMRFIAERLNEEEGGINGRPVEIVPFDNKLSAQETQVQLQKAIDEGIHFIAQADANPIASVLLNAIDKHNQRNPDQRVLYLNYGAIQPEFTNDRCSFWHFLFDANTDMKIKVMTDWVADQQDVEKVFLISQDLTAGHRFAEKTVAALKEKMPNLDIVGNVFHPLGKVKDFTPYITQVKASGADLVISSDWGHDMVLLIKAAASAGLDVPFVTLYANSTGTPSAMGNKGVDRVYLVWPYNGDYDEPHMAKRQVAMKQETGYDYGDIRMIYMMNMLKKAVEKADSTDPLNVAYALEGLTYDGPVGTVTMRARDHQIEEPMFVSVFTDGMTHGYGNTGDLNFHAIQKYSSADGELPTTCQMRRPPQP